jgi:hypothetical protein
MEGRMMGILLAPSKKKVKPKAASADGADKSDAEGAAPSGEAAAETAAVSDSSTAAS